MICCFMNFHEQENAKNLEEHLDKEIERAIEKVKKNMYEIGG